MKTAAAAAILTLAAASAAQDPERLRPAHADALRVLQPRIEAAIDKGVAWLLSTQQRDGSWAYERELFASGQTALCAYTLLKTRLEGLGPNDTPASWPLVARVDYLIDGEVVAEVDKHGHPWRADPCLVRHTIRERGTFRVTARVETVVREGEALVPSVTHTSKPVEIVVDHVLEDWMLDAATAATRNLLAGARAAASASSRDGHHFAERAVDGDPVTAWLFAKSDAEPLLRLRLSRSVRARKLWLCQANGQRRRLGEHDRIERIAVVLDRQEPIEIALDPDELAPTVFALPESTRFRQLEVRVLSRARGSRYPGIGGFAEIGVE